MAEKKEIRLPRWEGKEYYPATTTEAVADRQRKKGLDVILDDIDESLETKAPKSGYVPDLKVNFANELVGRGDAVPQEIGKMRPTGVRSIGDGNATITEMRGKSVVWNQWANFDGKTRTAYGLSVTAEKNGTVHIIGTYTGGAEQEVRISFGKTAITAGHKVLASFPENVKGMAVRLQGGWVYNGISYANSKFVYDLVLRYRLTQGQEIDTSIHPFIHDLTQMFGAGNEPTTIEEFEARKPLGVTNDYNEGEIVSFDAKALKSVGFNAWNGEYAKVIGGMEYRLEGAFTSIGFAKELGGEQTAITVAGDRVYTPSEDGYIYAKGTDVCIHLKHTYTPERHKMEYEEDVLELPDIKGIKDADGNQLFPYGLLSVGSVCDEVTATKAVKRVGRRAYATGDESNASVITDGTSTQYALATPIEVDLPEPLNMTYEAWDFGTEELVANTPTTPLNADIAYQFNAVDRIRENSAYKADKTEVEKIEKAINTRFAKWSWQSKAFNINTDTLEFTIGGENVYIFYGKDVPVYIPANMTLSCKIYTQGNETSQNLIILNPEEKRIYAKPASEALDNEVVLAFIRTTTGSDDTKEFKYLNYAGGAVSIDGVRYNDQYDVPNMLLSLDNKITSVQKENGHIKCYSGTLGTTSGTAEAADTRVYTDAFETAEVTSVSFDSVYKVSRRYYNEEMTFLGGDGQWHYSNPLPILPIGKYCKLVISYLDNSKILSDSISNKIALNYVGVDSNNMLTNKFKDMIDGIKFTVIPNTYVDSLVGLSPTSQNNNTTDYIPIYDYKHLRYNRVSTNLSFGRYGMAFYDKDKKYISGQAVKTNAAFGYEDTIIEVPEGALFARFTFRIGDEKLFYVYPSSTKHQQQEQENDIIKRNEDKLTNLYSACRYRKYNDSFKDLQMLICTDVHQDDLAMNNAVTALNGFESIDCMLALGDQSYNVYTEDLPIWWAEHISKSLKPIYVVAGNHDVGNNRTDISECASDAQVYDMYTRPMVDKGWLNEGEYVEGKNWYYKDFPDKSIRIIFVYEYEEPPFDSDGNYKYQRGYRIIKQEQAQWILDTLCSTPANYGVFIATHAPMSGYMSNQRGYKFAESYENVGNVQNYMSTDFLANAVNAFTEGNLYTETITFTKEDILSYNVTKDFSKKNSNVKFLGNLCGHVHADYIYKHNRYEQYAVASLCAKTAQSATKSDMIRTSRDGVCHESFTVVSARVLDYINSSVVNTTDRSEIALCKIGATRCDTGVIRDYEVLDFLHQSEQHEAS